MARNAWLLVSLFLASPAILGANLSTVSVNPTSVVGGLGNPTGTVTLDSAAPAGGAVVTLSSNNGAAAVPGSVTVAQGATTATFAVTTAAVPSNATVTLTGTYNAVPKTATLTVTTLVSTVTFIQANVMGGMSATGILTLYAPAPTGGAVVTLTSSVATRATVPASITIPAGATVSTFAIPTLLATTTGTTTITATNAGASRTAALTTSAVPIADSVTLAPATAFGTSSTTGTVNLNGVAPIGGTVVTLTSSNTLVATVPASVTVPAAASSTTFSIATLTVASNQTVTITAAAGGTSKPATLTVAPTIQAFTTTLDRVSVTRGQTPIATVTLNAPAPAGGATVTLTSSSVTNATVPASVVVTAGARTATYVVTTLVGGAASSVTISSAYGGATKSATLGLTATPTVLSVAFAPPSVAGGQTSTGTVTLSGPAPTGGTVVTLGSSNTAVVTVPVSVTVAATASTATFTATTLAVGNNVGTTITATVGASTASSPLTATAPLPTGVSLLPSTVVGGNDVTGTVTISPAAPTGGVPVFLSSSSTSTATVPTSVTVAAGATTATFTVTTFGVASATPVTISAVKQQTAVTSTMTVNPADVSTVTLNPTSVVAGTTSTGTVTLNGKARTGGVVVALTSSATTKATVPASVTVPAAATSATFTVTTVGVPTTSSVTISGTYNSITKNGSLTIQAASLTSVSLSASPVVGGTNVTGTVTLNGKAGSSNFVVALSSSDTTVATVPASVTVATNATTATFTVTTIGVAVNKSSTITATLAAVPKTVVISTTPAALTSLTLSPTSVAGGTSSTGTLTLNGNAPPSGAVVSMTSSDPSAVVPATVTVAANTKTKTFTVTTTAVPTTKTPTISGTYSGTTQPASLTVNPPLLSSLALAPASVNGGTSSTGTVIISSIAPSGGFVVNLTSDNVAATVPASVTVAQGATSATFSVSTTSVGTITTATITASAAAVTKPATLTINPVALVLSSVTLSPTSLTGGAPSTGTVTLSAPAQAGGFAVTLSSDKAAATVPPSVTVPAASSTTTFSVSTVAVGASTTATITAIAGAVTKTPTLTINPPVLSTISLSPATVVGGAPSSGTITITSAAPVGGFAVSLTSDNVAAVVPATATVSAGATTGAFTITTSATPLDVVATISGTVNGTTRTATLNVNASALSTLSVSPSTVVGGAGATGTISLTGPAPAGGLVVALLSSDVSAVVPPSALVVAGTSSIPFAITTTNVPSTRPVTITATLGSVVRTFVLSVTPCTVSPVSPPASFPPTDVVWVDDALPPGSVATGPWTWDTTQKASGTASHTEPATPGEHQHFFQTDLDHRLYLSATDKIVVYALLSPCDPPREIMLQFEYGGFAFRAYWGEDLLPLGVPGTEGHYYAGPLPPTGQWTRLEVPALAVGLDSKSISGVAFTLFGGQVWFDRLGKAPTCTTPQASAPSQSPDTVWVDDNVPTGALEHSFVWDSSQKASGTRSHSHVPQYGMQHHYFDSVPYVSMLQVGATDKLVLYALVDPCDPPQEIFIRWSDGNWDHGAYWGADLIDLNVTGSQGRVPMGPLPTPGVWTRLEVPASTLELGGKFIQSMEFLTYSGQAWFDRVGKSNAQGTAALAGLSLGASPVISGGVVTGTVTLTGAAPAGGVLISLTSDNTAAATVPSIVTVPAGSTSATFLVSTLGIGGSVMLNVGATDGSSTFTAPLTVNQATFSSLSISPTTVVAATSTGGTVTLNGLAPPYGYVVSLSSNSVSARVPSGGNVVVPAGASTAAFTIGTSSVASTTVATITASADSVVRTANLTINPCTFASAQAPSSFPPDTIWFDDSPPAGAGLSGTWIWDAGQQASGTSSHTEPVAAGLTQHFLQTGGASSLRLAPGDSIVVYALLDPCYPPREVMLQFYSGNSWEHRVLWGEDLIGWGVAGTESHHYQGSLPTLGQWTRLEVSAAALGLDGQILDGIAFTLFDGRVWFDHAGKINGSHTAVLSSVSVSPASVGGGSATTGTVTLNAPAAAGGLLVNLSGSNSLVASVPSSVTVSAASSTATFSVATSPVGSSTNLTITATDGTETRTTSLTVTPPGIAAFTLSPNTVLGGGVSTGTVTLTGLAPTGGTTVSLSSANATVAAVPATVTVGAGTSSTSCIVTTSPVATAQGILLTASIPGSTQPATITVNPADLVSVAFSPTSLTGGSPSTGTITLSGAAPVGGKVVSLSSSSGSAVVPATVTVLSGASTATFTVTTSAVGSVTTATITATLGSTVRTAGLTLNPPGVALSSLSLSPAALTGGSTSTGTVLLTTAAQAGGFLVSLSSNNAAATVPSSVTVSQGATTATFTVTTTAVASIQTATITASAGVVNVTAPLTVNPPPALSAVTLNPTSVAGGSSSTGTITLTLPALAGGFIVTLSSDNGAATVPASVTVAQGATSGTFSVATTVVGALQTATITATAASVTKTAALAVTPPQAALASVAVSPTSTRGGVPATGTVTLTLPAGVGGFTVNLSSNNASATVPASVVVLQGASTATFTVTTTAVVTTQSVTITAVANGVTQTAPLSVTPPPPALSSVTLSPASVQGGTTSTATVTLTGAAGTGGILVNTSSDNALATTPASIFIPQGQVSATFTVTTGTTVSSATANISAVANGVTKSAPLTVSSSPTGTLSGTVIAGATASVYPGVTVTVNGTGTTATTNLVGGFSFTLLPGSYTVTATLAPYQPATTSVVVVTAGHRSVAPVLSLVKATGTLTGTVTNGATPVSGALISVWASSRTFPTWTTTTATDGTFALTLPADAYIVHVSKVGFKDGTGPGLWTVVNAGSSASTGTIALSPGGTITGVVRDRNTGAPVVAADVAFGATSPTTPTDSTGHFTIGTSYFTGNFIVNAPGYATLTSALYTVPVGQVTAAADLLLEPNAAHISGHVILEADGSPAVGATVKVTGTSTSATTDATGAFVLAAPQGTYTFTISKYGFGDVVSPPLTVATGQTADIGTFQLKQRAVVNGVVVNSLTGLPVEATVATTGTGVSTATSGGAFIFASPAGPQTFTATKVGYQPLTTGVYDLPPGGSVDLGLIPLSGADVLLVTVSGVVKDALTLNPIVSVNVAQLGQFSSVSTDSLGRFSLPLLPGTYALTFVRSGYVETVSLPLVVVPGAPVALPTVFLSPLATVTGTVLNAQGQPIYDLPITAKGTKYVVHSDPSGVFALQVPGGPVTVQIHEPSSIIYESALTLAPGETRALGTIRLVQAAGFAATGMPTGSYHQISVNLTAVSSETTISGPAFLRVPPGTYTVTASSTGWVSQTFGPFTITPGVRQDLGQIAFARGGSVVGTVTSSADGAPIAGAFVSSAGVNAVTDLYGYFQISLPAGSFPLTITKSGFASATTGPQTVVQASEVNAGVIALTPQAAPPATLSGTVVNATGGLPLTGATVSLIGTSSVATTDGSGTFSIQAAPGIYDVLVTKSGWATVATSPITLISNANVSAGSIAISSTAGTATGVVIDSATLVGVAGAVVSVSGTSLQATTDSGGNFSLTLSPGSYSISAAKAGWYSPQVEAFSISASTSVSAKSLWMTRGTTFTGRVVNAYGGAGIEGVLVKTPFLAQATTNASGTFHLFVPATRSEGVSVPLTSFSLTKTNWPSLSTLSVYPVSLGTTVDVGTLSMDGKVTILGAVYYHYCLTCPVSASVGVTGAPEAVYTARNFQLQHAPGTGLTLTVKNLGAYDLVTQPFSLESGYPYGAGALNLLFPASVTGKIYDSSTGTGVAGATVTATPEGVSTTSGADGSYSLSVKPGPVTFVVSKAGYPTKSIPLDVPDITSLWNPQNFYLDPVDTGALQSVAFTTPTVPGGMDDGAHILIRLTKNAPVAGARISMSSSNREVMAFLGDFGYSANIVGIIAFGNNNSVFPVSTGFVTQDTPVSVTASYGGVTMTATTTVLAPPATLIGVSPGWVLPGDTTPVLYGNGIQAGSTVTFAGPVYSLTDTQHALCNVGTTCTSTPLAATVDVAGQYAAFAIPPSATPGIYFLKVRSANGVDSSSNQWIAVDSKQQTRAAVPPNQHASAQQIYPGQTVTGTLNGDGPLNGITDYNYYYFVATAGSRISLAMNRVDTSMTWENPASLDPQIEVVAPDGFIYANLQAFDNQPGVDYNASLANAVLPQTGVYFIAAETTRGSGQYQLTFNVNSMAIAPVGNRAVPIVGNHNTLPLNVTSNVQSLMLDSRGWPVAGAAYSFTGQNGSGDTGTASFQTGGSGTTSINGAAYGTIRMTTQGKARFKAGLTSPQLSQLTYLPSGEAAAVMGEVYDEAAGELKIPIYQPAALSSARLLSVSESGATLSAGTIERLPQEQLRGRLENRPAPGTRTAQAASVTPEQPATASLRKAARPVGQVRIPLVISTCSGELEVFTQSGVTPATLNAPFTVVLTDVTVGEAKGIVDTATGIHGHRIERTNGDPRTLRLHLDVKDSTGAAPTHPVLVSLAVGGPKHGTLIIDPGGSNLECSVASFIWHERDAQGNLIAPNEEFEYRLGTLSNYAGAVPDPAHPGQVLPVWGATEGLNVTISTVDGSGNATPLTTFDAAFPVRPEPGRPQQLVSPQELNGLPYDDVWEYWADYLTTTVGGTKLSGLYTVYNSFYLVDRWKNVTFGYGTTQSPTAAQNVSVSFTSQLPGIGLPGFDVAFPGYETDLSWSNAGGSMPTTYTGDLFVTGTDPEYGIINVPRALKLRFVSGTHSALISQQDYDLRFGVDDGTWPITVPPGATGAAIPRTKDPRNPVLEKQDTARRLNFQIVTGTNVPRSGEVFENPHSVWLSQSGGYVQGPVEFPDPHLEVSEPGRVRLSVVDSTARPVTDVAFVVHNCPRYDHEGPPNQPAQPGRSCTDSPVQSTAGAIASYSINPAGSSRGYMGVELLQAPKNPGDYFIKIESIDSIYRIKQLPGLTVDASAAGEYKGAFALCVVDGAEILDANFQRIDPLTVNEVTNAFIRMSSSVETGSGFTLDFVTEDEDGSPLDQASDVSLSRLGMSNAFLSEPIALYPEWDSESGSNLRALAGTSKKVIVKKQKGKVKAKQKVTNQIVASRVTKSGDDYIFPMGTRAAVSIGTSRSFFFGVQHLFICSPPAGDCGFAEIVPPAQVTWTLGPPGVDQEGDNQIARVEIESSETPPQAYVRGIRTSTTRTMDGKITLSASSGVETAAARLQIRFPTHLGSRTDGYPVGCVGQTPVPMENLILTNADHFGIPPQYLMAQVYAESMGNPCAFRYEATSVDFKSLTGDSNATVFGPTTRHLQAPTEGFSNLGITALSGSVEYLACETSGVPSQPCIAGQIPSALELAVPITMISPTVGQVLLQAGQSLYLSMAVYPTGGDPLASPYVQQYPWAVGPWPPTITLFTLDAGSGLLNFATAPSGPLSAGVRRLHPPNQPFRAAPGASFGSAVTDLVADIQKIRANNTGPAVPPANFATTIRTWANDGRGNPLDPLKNCANRYGFHLCGADLFHLIQLDGAFEVQGQWLAAASYGLLQIIPNSLNDYLKSGFSAADSAQIRALYYNPACGADVACASENDPVTRLFNPSICTPMAGMMDANADVTAEDDAPVTSPVEDVCPGDPTPSVGQCTWKRLWRRRFRVFNGGSETSTIAAGYAVNIVDTRSGEFLPR